jgi:hypothetical protein
MDSSGVALLVPLLASFEATSKLLCKSTLKALLDAELPLLVAF